jgi:glucose-6-phosphate 1-dehydrogenase
MTLRRPEPQAIVIFGASGDLTRRKIMPALYELFLQDLLPEQFAVIGYARREMTDEQFRENLRKGCERHGRQKPDASWDVFAEHIRYVSGEFEKPGAMSHLRGRLEETDKAFRTEGRRLFYCATPPSAFPTIARRLGEEQLTTGSRIVVEKPFGHDAESARELNRVLHESFEEHQIFRIDHYLGKETVQNILAFRFANGMFEPIWNRRYVSSVQIDVAEDIGIEGRGKFYEEAGAIRDIVQNHMVQLLAVLAMEPPASFQAESIRDEKVKVLRSIPPVEPENVVRGQYVSALVAGEEVVGYREEPDVAPDSIAETFVALKVSIENWRWAGVPFFLRTGKRLALRDTRVTVIFFDAPHMLFEESGGTPDPNHLTLRIQPNEGMSLTFDAKVPGPEMKVVPVNMDFDYEEAFGKPPAEAYERLLHDAMDGDRTLFTRADEIERAWEILEPILKPEAPDFYPAGSWGPERAAELVAPGHWYLR